MIEEALDAVRRHLDRVTSAEDSSLALAPEVLADARRLDRLLTEYDGNVEARWLLGQLHWHRYVALPEGPDREALDEAVDAFMLCFLTGAGSIPPPLLPVLADRCAPTVSAWLDQARQLADPEFHAMVADTWQRLVRHTPADHPEHAGRVARLLLARWLCSAGLDDLTEAVELLKIQFGRTGSMADLDLVTAAARDAVAATPADDPARVDRLADLGAALRIRALRTHGPEAFDESIEIDRQVARLTPAAHAQYAGRVSYAAISLYRRFQRDHSLADLDEAIEFCRVAAAVDGPEQAINSHHLGIALNARIGHAERDTDLAELLDACRQAVRLTASTDRSWPERSTNLRAALELRLSRGGTPADLDELVAATRAARDAGIDRPATERRLLQLLAVRFEWTRQLADLDEVIVLRRAAVARAGDPDALSELGAALRERYDLAGDAEALDEAVDVGGQAVDAAPPGHQAHLASLSNLGVALQTRFRLTAEPGDLSAAVDSLRQALAAADERTDPDHVAIAQTSLGTALTTRYQWAGALADLHAAIDAARAAVAATPVGHLRRGGRLTNLGIALHERFDRTGDPDDLDEAIATHRSAAEAMAASTAGPGPALAYANLGAALLTRVRLAGAADDLDEAVDVLRQAADGTPEGHPARGGLLSSLCAALRQRGTWPGGDPGDLDGAVESGRQAIRETLPQDQEQASHLHNLGRALYSRYAARRTGPDLGEALSSFAAILDVTQSAPTIRISAARAAAQLVARMHAGHAAHLLDGAVRLLPGVVPRQLDRDDQQHALREFAGLASDAAALALAADDAAATLGRSSSTTLLTFGGARPLLLPGDPEETAERRADRAVGLLELGRGVILSQVLDTRSDLTALRDARPELADRFVALRQRLDSPAQAGLAIDRHELVTTYEETLAEIRALDGFDSFLLPPTVDELVGEAQDGPVVMLNVSGYGSDALLVTATGITRLPLPGLTRAAVLERVTAFQDALRRVDAPDDDASPGEVQDTLSQTLEWLWDVAAGPVLDALGPALAETRPRIWWITGGLLGMLPIHAAGYHRAPPAERAGRTVLDRAVSSYTPTLRALHHARRRATRAGPDATSTLIVAVSGDLPQVTAEVATVRALTPNPVLLIEQPTKADVLDRLPGCAIAHFCCHGVSDSANPSRSRLVLHDDAADPFTVTSLAPLDLDAIQLAYLSACQTSLNSAADLADESIHLTSAFLLAGVPRVVGTLWEISDAVAGEIAAAVYSGLRSGPDPVGAGASATALHDAVVSMRDRFPATPSLWAAHTHTGA